MMAKGTVERTVKGQKNVGEAPSAKRLGIV